MHVLIDANIWSYIDRVQLKSSEFQVNYFHFNNSSPINLGDLKKAKVPRSPKGNKTAI